MGKSMHSTSNKPRIVFDFIRPPLIKLAEVESGKAPRESLLGYVQLRERGWPISVSDDRWHSLLGKLRQKLIFRLELPSAMMIKQWHNADIIVVTTRISLILTIIAKLLRKKIVFLDAMCEEIPKRVWRRLIIKLSLRMADACICLSTSQAQHWASQLNIHKDVFTPVFYGIDTDYYKLPQIDNSDEPRCPYLLAVGRDPRRDFTTLVDATNELDLDLIIVTKPYLVPEGIRNNPRVHIMDDLSYEELFKVYANAAAVVVPIKRNTTYMSGIRSTMEAMCLGVPVVASRAPGMRDYFRNNEELIYFEAEDKCELIKAVNNIFSDKGLRRDLTHRAKQKILKSYSVSNYADALERVLLSI